MAVRGPKARALAADLADTVTFALLPGEPRVEVARLVRDFRAPTILDVLTAWRAMQTAEYTAVGTDDPGWISPARTGNPSIRTRSARPSSASPAGPACRSSVCTT